MGQELKGKSKRVITKKATKNRRALEGLRRRMLAMSGRLGVELICEVDTPNDFPQENQLAEAAHSLTVED
jgi:hypothetical protein